MHEHDEELENYDNAVNKTHCMSYLCVFKQSLLGVKICLSHAQMVPFGG